MGKHVNTKLKYHYVMRYINGESPSELGRELVRNELTKDFDRPDNIIFQWHKKFVADGEVGLQSQSGLHGANKGPKKKIKYEDMTKEELIKIIEINDFIVENLKKKARARDKFMLVNPIIRRFKVGVDFAVNVLGVSKSGYFKWRKKPKTVDNYDYKLLAKISWIYFLSKKFYGKKNIWRELKSQGININIKTVARYMKFIGIQAQIRVPKKHEIKLVNDVRGNLINKNFKQDCSRVKLFTDTTQWNYYYKFYFSAVVSDSRLYSLNVSLRNDTQLITKDISSAIAKVGAKFILHSDNAAFYKTEDMLELITLYSGVQSFNDGDDPKDNRPIEYFWSILKLEYLDYYKPKTLAEIQALLHKIVFHFNNVRKQGNLDWKTPASAGVA